MDFASIAKTGFGKDLLTLAESIKNQIADVRYKPELSREARLAVIDVLDELLVNKLKVNLGKTGDDKNNLNSPWT